MLRTALAIAVIAVSVGAHEHGRRQDAGARTSEPACIGGHSDDERLQAAQAQNEQLRTDVADLKLRLWQTRDQLRDTRAAWQAASGVPDGAPAAAGSVDRRAAESLSFDEFMRDYASKGRPVIITGLHDAMFRGRAWDLEHFRRVCGQQTVPLLKHDKSAAAWGRLVPAGERQLAHFIDDLRAHRLDGDNPLYLHDWSLPAFCPQLFRQPDSQFVMPKYFAGDLLQQLPADEGLFYRDEWPSLFVGPKGSQSALHVDSFGSNFFMLLIEGRKLWRFFPEVDRPLLYEDVAKSTFDFDALRPDYERYPLAQHASPVECVLEPGEVLFVPAGSPHQVVNLDDTVAISANYIDQSNYARALGEIEREGQAGYERSRSMAQALREISKDPRRLHQRWNKQQEALPWDAFKRQ